MRKLPVYLLLDTSGSMHGEPIESVRTGVQTLVSTLKQDPHALETAYLSVITFSEKANQVVPLTEISLFTPPAFEARGVTSMGAALELLAERISVEVSKTTMEIKGDWKPIVFLMTDGESTDDLTNGIAAIKAVKIGTFIACAAGSNANTTQLKKITNDVLSLDTTDRVTIQKFFKWVTDSVTTTSKKIDLQKNESSSLSEFPAPPPEVNVVL